MESPGPVSARVGVTNSDVRLFLVPEHRTRPRTRNARSDRKCLACARVRESRTGVSDSRKGERHLYRPAMESGQTDVIIYVVHGGAPIMAPLIKRVFVRRQTGVKTNRPFFYVNIKTGLMFFRGEGWWWWWWWCPSRREDTN